MVPACCVGVSVLPNPVMTNFAGKLYYVFGMKSYFSNDIVRGQQLSIRIAKLSESNRDIPSSSTSALVDALATDVVYDVMLRNNDNDNYNDVTYDDNVTDNDEYCCIFGAFLK